MAEEKLKILHLMQLLLEETDEAHPLNAAGIAARMEARCGYSMNRKTIYGDVEKLRSFGISIAQTKGKDFGYYVDRRAFDLPELKLLVDAVQSSKFITRQKSEELIKKLEKLTSKENGRQLQRQVFIYNRIKAENETIYATVDVIHAAIRDDLRISFRYCEWTVGKELREKKDGAEYRVSPWALTWDNDNYYLVAYDDADRKIKHYRVDKMRDARLMREKRDGRTYFEHFDLAAFSRKTFSMYGGPDTTLVLECENAMAGVVIDRFGQDVMLIPSGEGRFRVRVTVALSPQFFGWLTGVGRMVRIAWPEQVRAQYRTYLREILENC